MKMPTNRFKAALLAGTPQIGLWNAIPGALVPELLANCGYDFVVIDTEHAPTGVLDVLPALQAIAAYPDTAAAVRPANNDPVLIKRLLDLGAQTLVVPYVQSAQEAAAAVRAMRYAPRGIRGVAGMTRASRYGQVEDYFVTAEEELCLIVQVETGDSLDRLEDIATVDGVDGVFIGPADLAASLGHPGNPGHPDVIAAIEDAIARLKDIGVPSGILTLDEAFCQRCITLGTTFTAIGMDVGCLAREVRALRNRFAPLS